MLSIVVMGQAPSLPPGALWTFYGGQVPSPYSVLCECPCHWSFGLHCLVSTTIELLSFEVWFLTLSHGDLRRHFVRHVFFNIYWFFSCGLISGLSGRKSHSSWNNTWAFCLLVKQSVRSHWLLKLFMYSVHFPPLLFVSVLCYDGELVSRVFL